VVGILSFAVLKLFKNETNKMLAGADVTEVAALVAASMDLSLGRGCDSNGESGNLQQADAFVLKEPGCARDSEEPDEGTAPTLHRDSNGESGVAHLRAGMVERLRAVHDKVCADLQQADAFVLKEAGCARDSEEPDEGATPTLHDPLNKMLAGADVTEAAESMALRSGRGCDSNGESGDLQQADAFVLKEEAGCVRNSEEPAEGATSTLHDQLPHAKLTLNEYRQRIDACLSWAQEAGAERVVCLELAQAWLQSALAHTERNKQLQSEQRANKSARSLSLLTQ
jgi:hypothetical protein